MPQSTNFGRDNILTAPAGSRYREKTSGWGALNLNITRNTYKLDALYGTGPYVGTVLRVDSPTVENNVIPENSMGADPVFEGKIRIKVAFFDSLHSCMWDVDNYAKAQEGFHHGQIDAFPTAIGDTTPSVGSKVLCDIGNINNMTNITFRSPSKVSIKKTGTTPGGKKPFKKKCDSCGEKAPGDPLDNASKSPNNTKALPCLPKGHKPPSAKETGSKAVKGDGNASDEANDILTRWNNLTNRKKIPGTNWFGNIGGQPTIIYQSNKCDLSQQFELILYYNSVRNFDNELFEKHLVPAIKEMISGGSASGNQRNFLLVIPKSPWTNNVLGGSSVLQQIKTKLTESFTDLAPDNIQLLSIIASDNQAVSDLQALIDSDNFKEAPTGISSARLVASPGSGQQASKIAELMSNKKVDNSIAAEVKCEVIVSGDDSSSLQSLEGVNIKPINASYADLAKSAASYQGTGGGSPKTLKAPCGTHYGDEQNWQAFSEVTNKAEYEALLQGRIPGTRFKWRHLIPSWNASPNKPGAYEVAAGVSIEVNKAKIYENLYKIATEMEKLVKAAFPATHTRGVKIGGASAYRNLAVNYAVDSEGKLKRAKRSPHMTGRALDVRIKDANSTIIPPRKVADAFKQHATIKGGLGLYPGKFTHYDLGVTSSDMLAVFPTHDPWESWDQKKLVPWTSTTKQAFSRKRDGDGSAVWIDGNSEGFKLSWDIGHNKTNKSPDGDGITDKDSEGLVFDDMFDDQTEASWASAEWILTPEQERAEEISSKVSKEKDPDKPKKSDASNAQPKLAAYQRRNPKTCPQRMTMGTVGANNGSANPALAITNPSLIDADGSTKSGNWQKISLNIAS